MWYALHLKHDAGDWDHNKGRGSCSGEVVLVPCWKNLKKGFIPFLAKVFSWEPAL